MEPPADKQETSLQRCLEGIVRCLLSFRVMPHTGFNSSTQNLLELSPFTLFLETRMGGGKWMAQGSKTTGNLELTKGFEEIVLSSALAL